MKKLIFFLPLLSALIFSNQKNRKFTTDPKKKVRLSKKLSVAVIFFENRIFECCVCIKKIVFLYSSFELTIYPEIKKKRERSLTKI